MVRHWPITTTAPSVKSSEPLAQWPRLIPSGSPRNVMTMMRATFCIMVIGITTHPLAGGQAETRSASVGALIFIASPQITLLTIAIILGFFCLACFAAPIVQTHVELLRKKALTTVRQEASCAV